MKNGKSVAAGKEMGQGMGREGEKFGKAVKETANPERDRRDREKKQQSESEKQPQLFNRPYYFPLSATQEGDFST